MRLRRRTKVLVSAWTIRSGSPGARARERRRRHRHRHRVRGHAAHSTGSSRSQWIQAESRPSPMGASGGRPAAQAAVANWQRGMKAQASPTLSGGGGAPRDRPQRLARMPRIRHRAQQGRAYRRGEVLRRPGRPRHIPPPARHRARRRGRQLCATTPRSWVTRMTAIPSVSRRCCSSLRIWSWMVTSSAVVGSSASSSVGFDARAMAIIARWRMPPRKLVRVVGNALRRRRDADEVEQLHRPARAARRGQDRYAPRDSPGSARRRSAPG